LVNYASEKIPVYLIDPNAVNYCRRRNINLIQAKATDGAAQLKEILLKDYV
jgi:hypothetical protein